MRYVGLGLSCLGLGLAIAGAAFGGWYFGMGVVLVMTGGLIAAATWEPAPPYREAGRESVGAPLADDVRAPAA
jgi:hypothetical protein